MKIIFLCQTEDTVLRVFNKKVLEKLDFENKVFTKEDITANPENFREVEFVFSTWGMPSFTEEEIKSCLPSLKAIFYAAGTVQSFAKEFLNCGVKIFSAWSANAVPVAEYTVAQILLSNKGFFALCSAYTRGDTVNPRKEKDNYIGNYNAKVGIIGAGMIGKKVIELLKPFKIDILVFDAFLSKEEISDLGGKKVSLEEIFRSCNIVSNHLANNEHTVGMLNYDLLKLMPENSTFINTGRGAQVVEDDLIKILEERKDITALLDVTHPEPPVENHKFFSLENCYLTPHIAGSSGKEVERMGDFMYNTYNAFLNNEKIDCEVTTEMLKTMA